MCLVKVCPKHMLLIANMQTDKVHTRSEACKHTCIVKQILKVGNDTHANGSHKTMSKGWQSLIFGKKWDSPMACNSRRSNLLNISNRTY